MLTDSQAAAELRDIAAGITAAARALDAIFDRLPDDIRADVLAMPELSSLQTETGDKLLALADGLLGDDETAEAIQASA